MQRTHIIVGITTVSTVFLFVIIIIAVITGITVSTVLLGRKRFVSFVEGALGLPGLQEKLAQTKRQSQRTGREGSYGRG